MSDYKKLRFKIRCNEILVSYMMGLEEIKNKYSGLSLDKQEGGYVDNWKKNGLRVLYKDTEKSLKKVYKEFGFKDNGKILGEELERLDKDKETEKEIAIARILADEEKEHIGVIKKAQAKIRDVESKFGKRQL